MSALGESYEIKLTTVTPVHIGSGRSLSYNAEYLNFGEQGIAIVDEEKVYGILGDAGMSAWINAIERRENILELLKRKKPGIQAADVAKWVLKGRLPANKKQDMNAQMRTGTGTPLIPGSSLKGAMRTGYFLDRLEEEVKESGLNLKDIIKIKPDDRGKLKIKGGVQLMNRLLNDDPDKRPKANFDRFRFIQVGDLEMKCETMATAAVMLNLDEEGRLEKAGNPLDHYEVIPSGTEGVFRLRLDTLPDRYKMDEMKKPVDSLEDLFDIINFYTEYVLYWESRLIRKGSGIAIQYVNFLNQIRKTHKKIQEEGHALLRVGHGSGWHFMTGGWAYDDELYPPHEFEKLKRAILKSRYRQGMPFPRTRKALENGTPFGFVKLQING